MPRYSGRQWTEPDLTRIRALIARESDASRMRLSQHVCELFDWRSANGRLKAMSCRVAMLAMHRDGLITLPPPRRAPPPRYRLIKTPAGDPRPVWRGSVEALAGLEVVPVTRGASRRLWNEWMARYHYLGYRMLPGAQLRYLIHDETRVLGAMGFGAAAWALAPRDRFIGWHRDQRERGLPWLVGQSRFLILPWIECHNLASKALALVCRRLRDDWAARYGIRPVLVETFVDTTRFVGTCYKAANWTAVGTTQGRGKLDRHHPHGEPIKAIYLKPLVRDFRAALCGAGA